AAPPGVVRSRRHRRDRRGAGRGTYAPPLKGEEDSMRFGWVGCHAEGHPALEALLDAGAPLTGVVTLRHELAARRSGAVDYAPLAARHRVPRYRVGRSEERRV